jgi:mRNA-degrading endonuclease RelE of RelBE toxin-antitoxin system
MSRYRLKVHKNAARYLERLPAKTRERTRAALDLLTDNPRDADRLNVKPLAGTDGLWRLR